MEAATYGMIFMLALVLFGAWAIGQKDRLYDKDMAEMDIRRSMAEDQRDRARRKLERIQEILDEEDR